MKKILYLLALLLMTFSPPLWGADIKISSLPAVTSVVGSDYLPLVASGATSRITLANLSSYFQPYYATLDAWGSHAAVNNGILGFDGSGNADVLTTLSVSAINLTTGTLNIPNGTTALNTGAGRLYFDTTSKALSVGDGSVSYYAPTSLAPLLLTTGGTTARTITFPDAAITVARTDAGNTFTGHQTFESVTATGATGTGKMVFDTAPTFVNASLGTGYLSTLKTVGAVGITANYLCTIEAATGKVNTAAASATGTLGIAITTRAGGSDLTSEVATRGIASCVMDTGSTSVVGNIAIPGTTVGGTCKDSGQSVSTAIDKGTQVLGKFLSVASPTNAASVQFYGPGHYGTQVTERLGAVFDGGGSAVAINKIVYLYVPYNGTITNWTVICNTAESTMVTDVLRLTFTAGTLPTASMVGAGNKPTPTNFETQAAPSSWTSVAVVAGDVLAFKVTTGAATATMATVSLDITR